MSLGVRLVGEKEENCCPCPLCGAKRLASKDIVYFSASITHNLNSMAEAAGIYKILWRPEEINVTKASQLIEPLTKGLELLKADPKKFKQFDASNGWGVYTDFIPWIEKYLKACKEYPDAYVEVSR